MNGYSTVGTFDRQPDLLAHLQNVVRQLNRPDIRTVSARIAKAIGDQKWRLDRGSTLDGAYDQRKWVAGSTNHGAIGMLSATCRRHRLSVFTVNNYLKQLGLNARL